MTKESMREITIETDKLAKIIVQIIIMILNYVFSKLFVFREK